MKVWLLNLILYIRDSYWFIPLSMTLSSIFLAMIVIDIDQTSSVDFIRKTGYFFLNNQPEGARAVLSTIASSMLMVTGVTFSMTLLAVSYALSQIGPRLIHNFTRDRVNQITLGLFIATFLYCLLILRTILSPSETTSQSLFVPHLGVFIALLLAIINIITFIFFIHHIQNSINVSEIIFNVGNKLISQIKELNVDSSKLPIYDGNYTIPEKFNENSFQIYSKSDGYLNFIDIKSLFEFASKNNCIIEVKYKLNDFVTKLSPILKINRKLEEEEERICFDCFDVGRRKNQDNGILFLADEMLEIIARALSPSMNDPFTAINSINYLQSAVEEFSKQKSLRPRLYDKNNNLRIIYYPLTLEKFVNHVFGNIQSYISRDRNTTLHLLYSIKEIIMHTHNQELINLLLEHAKTLCQAATDSLPNSQDVKAVSSSLDDMYKLVKNRS